MDKIHITTWCESCHALTAVADRVKEERERKGLETQTLSSQRKKAMHEKTKTEEEEHQKTSPILPEKQQSPTNELQSIFSKWKQQQQQQQQPTGNACPTGNHHVIIQSGPGKNCTSFVQFFFWTTLYITTWWCRWLPPCALCWWVILVEPPEVGLGYVESLMYF